MAKQIKLEIARENPDAGNWLYTIADMDLLEQFYDEIWLPEELYKVHHKAAITKRNEWFVDNSDLLVSYITRDSGGAARCQKYAENQGLPIKNIALEEE